MSEIIYSTIFHGARKRMGLSNDEFCLCDYIFKWQSNPRAPRPGWCSKTRNEMGEHIGSNEPEKPMSRRGIQKMIDRMVGKSLLEIDPKTRDVRATAAWFDMVVAENEKLPRPMKIGARPHESLPPDQDEPDGEQSAHDAGEQSSRGDVNKVHTDGEQSAHDAVNKVHTDGEQSSHNIKEGKESPKKRGKKWGKVAAPKTPPVIHRMVEVFEIEHKKHFHDESGDWAGFTWSEKEFGGLRDLRKKLAKRFVEKVKHEPGDDEIIDSFTLFLQRTVAADQFFLKVFTPAALNGQFQNAVNRIYGQSNHSNGSTTNVSNGQNGATFFGGYGKQNP